MPLAFVKYRSGELRTGTRWSVAEADTSKSVDERIVQIRAIQTSYEQYERRRLAARARMNIETVMDEVKLQRYRQASEWFVCFTCASPSAPEVERWLAWCEKDARNLAAFEEVYRDWNDLEGLRTEPPRPES